ncbi:MAG: ParB N-terminal domain-containing protein [Gemmatimonadales bacterium]
MSDRNHFLPAGSSDSFAPFTATDTPADSPRGFREGLPPAFRMRADAHYVEQLDGALPAVTVQFIAVHAIDVSDAPADALPALVESIKRHGVLEPLVVQRNNGTYKTITGQKRLAAARAAGLRDVPCLVHHVSDERAQALRELLRAPAPAPAVVEAVVQAEPGEPAEQASASVMEVAIAALRLTAAAPEAKVTVVKTPTGARLSIDLPFAL